jgi:hypothetical protein
MLTLSCQSWGGCRLIVFAVGFGYLGGHQQDGGKGLERMVVRVSGYCGVQMSLGEGGVSGITGVA